ncbi:MAG TPA: methyltransferase domain-containing protein [Ignavibacteriaceae bacterium]|nr:methyltransferase domain-containing protein [Ignavibacteriaceae bacterium]
MEIESESPAWLDKSHPNFLRWQKGRAAAEARGDFVKQIVSHLFECKNLSVLDLGSGEGGTSKVFSKDNFVVSFDLSLTRLVRQNSYCELQRVNGDGLIIPFKNASFDLVIVQDVIEHLQTINEFYTEIIRVLKPDGTIYLSTPNKLSIFNFLADPHFGLPVVSILKRENIKKYFLKYFRKKDFERSDVAQLLSLKEIVNIFNKDFNILLHTKFSVIELFSGNKGIVWSEFHLTIIRLCKFIHLDWLIIKLANDKFGLVNKMFTPTFYFTLKRK